MHFFIVIISVHVNVILASKTVSSDGGSMTLVPTWRTGTHVFHKKLEMFHTNMN